jgi:hypothetical protein
MGEDPERDAMPFRREAVDIGGLFFPVLGLESAPVRQEHRHTATSRRR